MTGVTPKQKQPLLEPHRIHLLIDPDHWTDETLRPLLISRPDIIGSILVGGTFIHSGTLHAVAELCSSLNIPFGNILTVGFADQLINDSADFGVFVIVKDSQSNT